MVTTTLKLPLLLRLHITLYCRLPKPHIQSHPVATVVLLVVVRRRPFETDYRTPDVYERWSLAGSNIVVTSAPITMSAVNPKPSQNISSYIHWGQWVVNDSHNLRGLIKN